MNIYRISCEIVIPEKGYVEIQASDENEAVQKLMQQLQPSVVQNMRVLDVKKIASIQYEPEENPLQNITDKVTIIPTEPEEAPTILPEGKTEKEPTLKVGYKLTRDVEKLKVTKDPS